LHQNDLIGKVLLLGQSMELRVVSVDGKRTWPELGFPCWFIEDERGEGEGEMGNLGFASAVEGYL
jgi:hypothetical protein